MRGDLRVSFPKPCDEKWEAMTPVGRDRVCARCDKVIRDLSSYAFEEAEALLRGNPDACVRARVDAGGVVALKPSRRGGIHRMVVAIGASASLLAASEPALAGRKSPKGVISGKVETSAWNTRVTATGADGKPRRVRVKADGRYKIKHLPAGSYKLIFAPDCGDSWVVDGVVVEERRTIVTNTVDPNGCIVVGLLRIENDAG
jgi:hypothetical protein